ncbi:myo-inositol-1(or 4)-monophosphatase [Nocardiopsis arvandica]|uniref:Myo-inositol-1(Or 4)-monophosphatase n=1 Tax=Nocardiopsis sinuspersici TaxID=501010 RepID=A0A7Z0BII0_9ACTN|nr:inositol monophosphatase family protein [Nocardiopsis sinuspersici]NYH50432.1 myo-inositol-1(or 4)-monophosphatase [Nocardiopsis sinuspersici]
METSTKTKESFSELPSIAAISLDVVSRVLNEARGELLKGALEKNYGSFRNIRHEDNFLSRTDIRLHHLYRRLLAERIPEFTYLSEEGDPEHIGAQADGELPDLCVLVDPLDTSEMAVRAMNGYTHLLVYSRSIGRPVAAVVGDIFHHVRIYAAYRKSDSTDSAFIVTSEGRHHAISPSETAEVNKSVITSYTMRPKERFVKIAHQDRLINTLAEPSTDGKSWGRIGVDFGSVGLCHVAAGFTDCMLECAKGFALWDLYPGHYILESSGGSVIDLDGSRVPIENRLQTSDSIQRMMKTRQKFVAAGSSLLAHRILALVDH